MSWLGHYAKMYDSSPLADDRRYAKPTRPAAPVAPVSCAPRRGKVLRPKAPVILRCCKTTTSHVPNRRRSKRPFSAPIPRDSEERTCPSIDSAWAKFGEAHVLTRQKNHQEAWTALLEAKCLIDKVHVGCHRRHEALLQLGHELSALTHAWLLCDGKPMHSTPVHSAAMDSPATAVLRMAHSKRVSLPVSDLSDGDRQHKDLVRSTNIDTPDTRGLGPTEAKAFVSPKRAARHVDGYSTMLNFDDDIHRISRHAPKIYTAQTEKIPRCDNCSPPEVPVPVQFSRASPSPSAPLEDTVLPPRLPPPPPIVQPNLIADLGDPCVVPLYAFEVMPPSASTSQPARVGPMFASTIPRRASHVSLTRSMTASAGAPDVNANGKRALCYTSLYKPVSQHESQDTGDNGEGSATTQYPRESREPLTKFTSSHSTQRQHTSKKDTVQLKESAQGAAVNVRGTFDPMSLPISVKLSRSGDSLTSALSSVRLRDCFRDVASYPEARALHQRMVRRLLEERAAEEKHGSPGTPSRAADLLGRLEDAYHEWLVDHLGMNGRAPPVYNIPSTIPLTPEEGPAVDHTSLSSFVWSTTDCPPGLPQNSIRSDAVAPNGSASASHRLETALAFGREQQITPMASSAVEESVDPLGSTKSATVVPLPQELNGQSGKAAVIKGIRTMKKENKIKNSGECEASGEVLGPWHCGPQRTNAEWPELKEERSGRSFVFLRC